MRGLLAGVVAVALVTQGAGHAMAQDVRPLTLPAARLPEAAAALTASTGTQVLWQGVEYSGRTRPVAGAASVEEALNAMLAGTGLTWRQRSPGTVEIVSVPQPVRLDAGTVELPQIDVTATGISPYGVLGPPPPAYAGGQMATGTQHGLFGNRSIFETPFNQRGFTREFIENFQARGLTDVLAADPTVRPLTNGGSNFEGFLIRGFDIGRTAILFDGLAGLIQNYHQVVDPIERIEVLNGPRTFLNGQPPTGAVGGMINLIPKRATDTPVTDLVLRYTAPGSLGAAADLGRRFGEGAFGVRLNAGTQGGNTAIRDQSERQDFAFLALDWRGDRARLALDVGVQQYEIEGVRIGFSLAPGIPVPRPPRNDRLHGQPWETDRFERYQAVLRGEYDLAPQWTAGLAFGYSRYDTEQRATSATIRNAAGTGTAAPYRFDTYSDSYVAEATLRGRFETGPLRHLLALSGSRSYREGGTRIAYANARPTNIYFPSLIPESEVPTLLPLRRTTATEIRGFAIGDEIGIWDDRILLTAGLRWADVTTRNFDPATGRATSRYQADRVSPAVGLVVRPTSALSLYANYVEALEQGGVAPTTAVNAGESAPPLVSDQIEVGAKYDFGRVAVTASLFRIEKANSYVDPATRRYTTEGRQVHQGVEFTAFGEPIPGLRILTGVTLLDAEVTRSAGGTLDGRRPVAVPRAYGSISADWDVPWVPGLALNGSVQATGSQFVDAANSQRVRGYALLNLGARYTVTVRETPVTLRFNVLNVTGEDYYASAGFGTLLVGAPRTFLLSSAFRF